MIDVAAAGFCLGWRTVHTSLGKVPSLLQIIAGLDELKAGCVLDEMSQPKGMA